MTASLGEAGASLIENGYRIVPIQPGQKRPVDFSWAESHASASDLAGWLEEGRSDWGVGILAEETPGIDIDVTDKVVVERLVAWCQENGLAAGRRVGRTPKVLLPCHAPAPFRKIASRVFRSPDGCRHRVEILGQGQQWVAYHVHPGTGRPYVWSGAEPLDTPAELLPTLTAAKARELVEYFESIVPAEWVSVTKAPDAHNGDAAPGRLKAPVAKAASALRAIPNDYDRDDWVRIGHALKAATADDPETGRELWHEWSEKWHGYDAEHTETAWDGFNVRSIGAGTLFREARTRGGWTWAPRATDEFDPVDLGPEDEQVARIVQAKLAEIQAREGLPSLRASSLAKKTVPPREWHVAGLVPAGNVTLLSGDGATGKSLLALMLASATVAGRQWLGLDVRQGGAVYFSAEDDTDEMHRRLADIAGHYGHQLAALGDLHLLDFTGDDDPILGKPDATRATIEPTDLFQKMRRFAARHRPKLIVFDTLADIFGGDEILRSHARRFIGILRGLAIETGAAVVVLAHPSLAGMASGSGTSGSTGWSNSVRSRLYFERITERANGQRETEADPDRRVLRRKKANYGRAGDEIELRWANGVFVPASVTDADARAAEKRVERKFVQLLHAYTAEGRNTSVNPGSTYAPALFAKDPRRGHITKGAFVNAMNRLLAQKAIAVEESGPPSKRRARIVIKAAPPPDYEAPSLDD
ncbi:MAG: hypothetical protein Rhirs2KO_12620 [Rhizobiaceae bacterium]